MGTWILIVMIWGNTGVAMHSVEFNNKAACENTKDQMIALLNKSIRLTNMIFVCSQK